MKKIEFAHEILSESRRSTQIYLESGRDYDKVKANMYSIFECYAHGLITWNQVRTRWHSSILEYLNLYADRPDLYLVESNRMLGEYETTLRTHKLALDEYKRVNEQKMTSNIVVKGKLNESQAKDHSNVYFNRRALTENELKDTATMKTWKRVQESYPNLTSKDELRIRMLTVFEGSTVDTTKMVTTYMSEEPTVISGPMQTSIRPRPRPVAPNSLSNVYPPRGDMEMDPANMANRSSLAPTTSPRPQARPAAQSIGAGSQATRMPNGSVDGSTRGVDPRDIYSPEDLAKLTGQPASRLAPTTSPRPMPRPATLKQSANNNIRKEAADIFKKIKATANEGYKVLPPMNKERYDEIPGLEGPFTTLSGKVVYYDPKEGAYYDRDTDMYLSNDEYTALNTDYSGMQDERDIKIREAKKPKPGHNARVMARAQDTIRKSIEKSKKDDDDDKEKVDEAGAFSYGKKPRKGTVAYNAAEQRKKQEKDEKPIEPKDQKVGNAKITKEGEEFKKRQSVAGLKKMIDDHDARAKTTTSPLKKEHHRKMSQQLRDQLADIKEEVELDEAGSYRDRGAQNMMKASRKADKEADKVRAQRDKDEAQKKKEVDEANTENKSKKRDYLSKLGADANNKKAGSRKIYPGQNAALKLGRELTKEESELDEATHWEVSYDYGPHQSNTVSVEAKSKEEAIDKAKQVAKDVHKHNRITSISISPKKNESLDESKGYVGRETKDGTWRVFKTGNAVAAAGPFKSAQEAQAWIKKQSMQEKVDEAASFKLKVTNPATGNSETQEFNSETALKDYTARAKQRGLKVSRIKSTNEAQSMGDALKNALSRPEPGSKLDHKIKVHNRAIKSGVSIDSGDSDLMPKAPLGHHFDKKGMIRLGEGTNLSEAVTLDYSRYMRSHGKKPRDSGGGSSTWMFTTAEFGEPGEDEVFQFQGNFADAKKAAAKWAKSQGQYRVYAMEDSNGSVQEAGGIGGGMSGTKFSKAADYAPAVGAGVRGAADNVTLGTGKYARAAADYGVKNLGSLAGLNEPTSWEKELKQELEKDIAAQTDYPVAWDRGNRAATAAQIAYGGGMLKLGAKGVGAALAKAAEKKAARGIEKQLAKDFDATDFALGSKNNLELTPQMRVRNEPLNLTQQMRVPKAPTTKPTSGNVLPFRKKP